MKQEPIGYINLTDSVFFKRYCVKNDPVLFSLMKSYLWLRDEESALRLINPNILPTTSDQLLYRQDTTIPPDILDGKQIVLDMRVKLDKGENVNIEMQTYSEEHFQQRMSLYLAQLHSQQPKRGDKYDQVMPSHLLVFTTFNVYDKGDHIARMIFTMHGHPDVRDDNLELVVVQLSKFNKSLYELVDMPDRWCYIIKHSAELTTEQVEYLSQDGETRMALEHLAEISQDERERWEAISLARREWEDQLMEEKGRVQGMQEGRVQGMQEGEVNKARGIALSMLQKSYEVSEISEVTGLSIAEIKQLNGKAADSS